MLTPDKIIEIFVKVDDFCKEFETEIAKNRLFSLLLMNDKSHHDEMIVSSYSFKKCQNWY